MWPMRRAENLTTFMCRLSWNAGTSTSWNPQGLSRPVYGIVLLLLLFTGDQILILKKYKNYVVARRVILSMSKIRDWLENGFSWQTPLKESQNPSKTKISLNSSTDDYYQQIKWLHEAHFWEKLVYGSLAGNFSIFKEPSGSDMLTRVRPLDPILSSYNPGHNMITYLWTFVLSSYLGLGGTFIINF